MRKANRMWTKADVVQLFDSYIFSLRVLARGSDLSQVDFCLPAQWSLIRRGQRSLYLFEVAGIKASGYPEILNRVEPTEYGTPATFIEFLSGELKSPEGAALLRDWRSLPEEV